jgi:hypothetical protein
MVVVLLRFASWKTPLEKGFDFIPSWMGSFAVPVLRMSHLYTYIHIHT